ncbi:MAG: rane protein [Verrucomicrobia bacterium]|nr:rane protein [Verrucomicrobiota bacterium]
MLEWRRTLTPMPKYVIEREIPEVGKFTPAQLGEASRKSCNVLQKMAPRVQWIQSYVTSDKLYCIYIAANEEAVREHARQGGFPANRISEVKTIIDPTTGGT